jgi:hypothetical protein
MKNAMKTFTAASVAAVAGLWPLIGSAQQATTPITESGYIKGTMVANFQTQRPENREGEYPVAGVADVFDLDLSVGFTRYAGEVKCLPHIFSKHLGRVLQVGSCSYDVDLVVINPQNTSQTKTVGKLVGTYGIDEHGRVNLSNSNLRMEVQTIGKAQGFTSPFGGGFVGRPPQKVTTLSKATEVVKKEVRTIERMVGSRKVSVALGDVDPVRFESTRLAMGPVTTYPEATVNGELVYSYETDNWFPQLTFQSGSGQQDTVGGGMKWVDDTETEGHYELNVIFNEQQAQGESAAFESAQGEDAFFMSDSTQSVINGRIGFKDEKIDATVVKSDIRFDLGVQNVLPLQAQNFTKLLLLLPEQMWGE